jgi:hypothetical protein
MAGRCVFGWEKAEKQGIHCHEKIRYVLTGIDATSWSKQGTAQALLGNKGQWPLVICAMASGSSILGMPCLSMPCFCLSFQCPYALGLVGKKPDKIMEVDTKRRASRQGCHGVWDRAHANDRDALSDEA